MQLSQLHNTSAPGVYLQNLQPRNLQLSLVRSDIAAFIGYASQGPTVLPIRVNSWGEFLSIFGAPLPVGHLATCVKGFFENGGQTCYILRLVDADGAAASTHIAAQDSSDGHHFEVSAAFNMNRLTSNYNRDGALPDSAVLQHFPPGEQTQPLENKGAWGNNLAISVQPSSLLVCQIIALDDDGSNAYLPSIVGLEKSSVIRLTQTQQIDGKTKVLEHIAAIKHIDPFALEIEWETPIISTLWTTQSEEQISVDLALPIQLETIEFDVTLTYENRLIEQFANLSPHDEHSRSLYAVIKKDSEFIQIRASDPQHKMWYAKSCWPTRVQNQPLSQGRDGLLKISELDYEAALERISKVEEVSMLCAPDLVLPDVTPQEQPYIPPQQEIDCAELQPPKQGQIKGVITDGETGLAGVTVIDLNSGKQALTTSSGEFAFDDIDKDIRRLRLSKPGFNILEVQALAQLVATPYTFSLRPLGDPVALSQQAILNVQKAMLNPYVVGRYKIALLDPPSRHTKIEQIRDWRAQLGDADIGALAYPWLSVVHPTSSSSDNVFIPPSGHFAGLLARAERIDGVHRACANIRMKYAKGLTQSLTDTHVGLFTPAGITSIEANSGQGIRIKGARTLSSDGQWRYLPVRRLIFAIEKSLEVTLQWTVFEPNTTLLRQAVLQSITGFLTRLWQQGMLAGTSQSGAFLVKCDQDNNPLAQIDKGRLVIDIAVAPSVPFEFIKIRFGKTLDALEVNE